MMLNKNLKDVRIALISPRAVASKNMIRRVQPPLGLCCIAAGLREKGFKNLMIYDTLIEDYNDVRSLKSGDGMITYGASGEKIIEKSASDSIIIRTSWLYSMYGNNFVKTMIKKGEKGEKIYVINDQFGCPTYSKDLVDCTLNIIVSNKLNKYKVYNFSNEGFTNWYEFTKKIFELKKITCDVIPIDSNSYKTTATRPKFSVTDKSRIKDIFNLKIRSWDEALEEFIYNYK